jgi:GDPmannose 4,6-dehydratase
LRAFITGITGQDGYYLSKLLLEKGYEVHGTIRRTSLINTSRIDPLIAQYSSKGMLNLHYSDLSDSTSLINLINKIKPSEIYNLAAQSHVSVSFKNPYYTALTGSTGTISILEAVKNADHEIKFYQASSSEMFGGIDTNSLDENSILNPKSPYAAGKVFSHNMTEIYRDSYDLFCVNGILFNHESPHRGETFVTRKISKAVGRIYHKIQKKVTLGNHDNPENWVLATGSTHTVKEFAQLAFGSVGLDWEDCIITSEKYFRPNEVDHLLGDYSKAKNKLGWEPKTNFNDLVKMMVESDMLLAEKEKVLLEKQLIEPTWEHPAI